MANTRVLLAVPVLFAGLSCSRTGHNLPNIPAKAVYDRDAIQYVIHLAEEGQEMAQTCGEKTERNELRQFCTEMAKEERQRAAQLGRWLAEWYQSKADSSTQRSEHSTEEFRSFRETMGSAKGAEFDEAFLRGMRVHHRDGLAHTADCQMRALHSELKEFCAVWNRRQQDELKQINAWVCLWFRDCVER